MGHPHWPLFDLAIRTPRVELRYPDDSLLAEMATLAMGEIHPPETMPFGKPWTDVPAEHRGRGAMVFVWRTRASWSAEEWHCPFVTIVEGRVVGMQSIQAHRFRQTRTVTSGSWLGLSHQGRGIGKEMRAAVIQLAFVGLDALRCESAAFEDNLASLGVSRALGYVDNGDVIHPRRDGASRMINLVLPRDAWTPRDDVAISGLDACRDMFG